MTDLASMAERLARQMGLWRDDGDGLAGQWTIVEDGDLYVVGPSYLKVHSPPWSIVDPGTALVFMFGLARGLTVDLGVCPTCRGTGVQRRTTHSSERQPAVLLGPGWQRLGPPGWAETCVGRRWVTKWSRACPECKHGRRTTTLAQAVLDARPCTCSGRGPETRSALHVFADRLQGDGDPLGVFVTEWLRGPCGECNDGCPKCHGHGTVLGASADLLEAYADIVLGGVEP